MVKFTHQVPYGICCLLLQALFPLLLKGHFGKALDLSGDSTEFTFYVQLHCSVQARKVESEWIFLCPELKTRQAQCPGPQVVWDIQTHDPDISFCRSHPPRTRDLAHSPLICCPPGLLTHIYRTANPARSHSGSECPRQGEVTLSGLACFNMLNAILNKCVHK